jgi:hypothetical protein
VPATHEVHVAAPAADQVPAAQVKQLLALAPGLAEAVPAAQAVHVARPFVGATVLDHVPAGHCVHAVGPEPPVGTATEYVPARQLPQVFEVRPVAAEKVPLGQLTHCVMAALPVVVA